jgi:hypothetical protein
MNRKQYDEKYRLNPGISQSELERKWMRYQDELLEDARAFQAVVAVASSGGGGSSSSDTVTLVTSVDGEFGATAISSTGYVGVVWWDSSTPEIFGEGNPESYTTFLKDNDGTSREVTFYSCAANGFRTGTMSYLSASGNNISDINLSNCFSLNLIEVSFNNLTTLDVSSCSSLDSLSCSNNSISSLGTLPPSLTVLECGGNALTSLNVLALVNLTNLSCYQNNLTTLDVSSLSNLTDFSCFGNDLTSLDVSFLVNLINLYCHTNLITSLDFSNCTSIQILQANACQLTSITSFAATGGSFTFDNNELSDIELDSYFTILGTSIVTNYIGVTLNPGSATCYPTIAEDKGWTVTN